MKGQSNADFQVAGAELSTIYTSICCSFSCPIGHRNLNLSCKELGLSRPSGAPVVQQALKQSLFSCLVGLPLHRQGKLSKASAMLSKQCCLRHDP